jgi:hypothetical protein
MSGGFYSASRSISPASHFESNRGKVETAMQKTIDAFASLD